jgi:hypothetical protein
VFHHFNKLYHQQRSEGTYVDVVDMVANIPSIIFLHENNQLIREITEE